jgi:S1-C subfamily serine protease
VFALTIVAPAQTVRLRLHVVLVDRELNQKPVPWFIVRLRREGTQNSEISELKTRLNGECETEVPAGRYQLATPFPIDLQGRRYTWSMGLSLTDAHEIIELTNDNATVEQVSSDNGDSAKYVFGTGRDLTLLFERLKKSTVTVRADAHEGSGFIVDASGLIVTNNHVVEFSRYLAVLFDRKHKVTARLLAVNPSKDIAVLWVNLQAFPEAVTAALVSPDAASQVAERVFTIGSPMGRERCSLAASSARWKTRQFLATSTSTQEVPEGLCSIYGER